MPPIIDAKKCVACGVCAAICPMQIFVHKQDSESPPEVRFPEECWHCLCCEFDCAKNAIKVRLPLPLMLPSVEGKTLRAQKGDEHD